MQMQQQFLDQQELVLAGDVEQFLHLCAVAEMAGLAVADSSEDEELVEIECNDDASASPSLWTQIRSWSGASVS